MNLHEFLSLVRRTGRSPSNRQFTGFGQLPSFADQLQTVRPRNVRAVIALPPWPVRSSRRWLHLLALATGYRADFTLIHRLAADLVPAVLNTGIVPIIEPLHERDLTTLEANSEIIVNVLSRGTLLYEQL